MEEEVMIKIITALTGLIGATTGLVAAMVSYLTYRRDGINIKIVLLRNMQTLTPGRGLSKKAYAYLSVINKSKSEITISKAGYVFLKKRGGAILADSMRAGPQKLKHGEKVDYSISEEKTDFSEISYVAAYDTMDNVHKLYLAPWYQRVYYWFLDFSKIKRKKSVVNNKKD